MDNLLIQVNGRKRVVLFSPRDATKLYLNGDKSEVLDIDNPDLSRYPKFAEATPYECFMEPGDVLFIPAMWFHNVMSLQVRQSRMSGTGDYFVQIGGVYEFLCEEKEEPHRCMHTVLNTQLREWIRGNGQGKIFFCQEEAGQGNLNMASPNLLWANYNRIT